MIASITNPGHLERPSTYNFDLLNNSIIIRLLADYHCFILIVTTCVFCAKCSQHIRSTYVNWFQENRMIRVVQPGLSSSQSGDG